MFQEMNPINPINTNRRATIKKSMKIIKEVNIIAVCNGEASPDKHFLHFLNFK